MRAIVLFFVVFLAGCATLFKGTKESVSFDGGPGSVEVYVNGQKAGVTPFKMELKSDKEYTIEFRKEGYKSKTYTLSNKVGAGWVILDILGGLLPVVIDAATGAWYSLDQTTFNTTLEK